MKNRVKRLVGNTLGVAINWRVRDVLERELQATVQLGKTFVEGAAQINDKQNLLELQIVELNRRVAELETLR